MSDPARPALDVELAPVDWRKTVDQEDAQQRPVANVVRQVALGKSDEIPARDSATGYTYNLSQGFGNVHHTGDDSFESFYATTKRG